MRKLIKTFLQTLEITLPTDEEVNLKFSKIFDAEHLKSFAGGEIIHFISPSYPFKFENKWHLLRRIEITYLVNKDGSLNKISHRIVK